MLVKINNRLCSLLKIMLVIVFLLLVLDVLWGVITRFISKDQASWTEELACLLMVWLALLGAAMACRENSHLGLDVIVRAWPEEVQRLSRIFTTLAILAFAGIIMAWGGSILVHQRFQTGQTLSALGILKAWFYLAIPVSGLLICSFSLEALGLEFRSKGNKNESVAR